jgi:hypothetical protein
MLIILPGLVTDVNRRQYLAIVGSGLTLTSAGCVGDDGDDESADGGNGGDGSTDGDNGGDDGSSNGGNGGDGSTDGGNGGDGGDSDPGDDDSDDNGQDDDPSSTVELQSIASAGDYFDTDAVELSGTGGTVSDPISLREGVVAVDYEYQGEGTFYVDAVDGPNDSNVPGLAKPPYTPIEAVSSGYISNPGEYQIEIVGDGEWSLVIAEPDTSAATVPTPPVSASGTGPDLVGPVTLEGGESVTATHDGQDPFTVQDVRERNASELSFAIFETRGFDDEKTGQVDASGHCWIAVAADGEWSLEIE